MRKLCVLIPLVLTAACGGSSTAPTPQVSTTGVTVTLPAIAKVGESQQASATAARSDGSSQAVSAGFQSDAPSVASVTDGGLVTGQANGQANIFVVKDGRQGSKLLRVVPDYQGSWSGRYTIATCTSDGIIRSAGGCTTSFGVGSSLQITAQLTQTADVVTGTISFGSLTGPQVTTPIGADGSVQTQFVLNSDNTARIDATVSVNQITRGQLVGTVRQAWLSTSGFAGSMTFTGNITSGGRLSGHPLSLQRVVPRSISEALRALTLP
jgi:hypothetical protein